MGMYILQGIAFIIAISGYALNGTKEYRAYSFGLWLTSNSIWGGLALYSENYILAAMFLVYNIFSIHNLKKELKN